MPADEAPVSRQLLTIIHIELQASRPSIAVISIHQVHQQLASLDQDVM